MFSDICCSSLHFHTLYQLGRGQRHQAEVSGRTRKYQRRNSHPKKKKKKMLLHTLLSLISILYVLSVGFSIPQWSNDRGIIILMIPLTFNSYNLPSTHHLTICVASFLYLHNGMGQSFPTGDTFSLQVCFYDITTFAWDVAYTHISGPRFVHT